MKVDIIEPQDNWRDSGSSVAPFVFMSGFLTGFRWVCFHWLKDEFIDILIKIQYCESCCFVCNVIKCVQTQGLCEGTALFSKVFNFS